jgi:hypothetical protein
LAWVPPELTTRTNRYEPTEAGEQAGYRDEMRAPDDDRDGQQEDDEGSQ